MIGNIEASENSPVFMMKDLRKQYQNILRKHGATAESIECVNVTRLKEAILAEMPDLFEKKKGKFTILTSSKPLGNVIFEASKTSPRIEGSIIYTNEMIEMRPLVEKLSTVTRFRTRHYFCLL